MGITTSKSLSINLSTLADEISCHVEEAVFYFDKITYTILMLSDELECAAKKNNRALLPDWYDDAVWESALRWTNSPDDFIALPDGVTIDEYRMMQEFATTLDDDALQEKLAIALNGSGAFRRFKDVVHTDGCLEHWYTFKEAALIDIAKTWCEQHEIHYTT